MTNHPQPEPMTTREIVNTIDEQVCDAITAVADMRHALDAWERNIIASERAYSHDVYDVIDILQQAEDLLSHRGQLVALVHVLERLEGLR